MRTWIPIILGALALGGCASSQSNQQPTTAESKTSQPATAQGQGMGMGGSMQGGTTQKGNMMGGGMAGTCPMAVEGTSVRCDDTDDGVALSFTTTGDVAGLRERVSRMAEMYGQHQTDGRGFMMRMMQMRDGMQGSSPAGDQADGMHGGGMMGDTQPIRSQVVCAGSLQQLFDIRARG